MRTSAPDIIETISHIPKPFLKSIEKKIDNKLFRLCLKYHKKLKQLSKELLVEELYKEPLNSKNDNNYRGLKNHMKGKVEIEFGIKQLENSPILQKQLLLNYLSKLPDAQCFFNYAYHYISKLEKQKKRGIEEYQMLKIWCRSIHYHPDYDKFKNTLDYLQKSIDYKTQEYLLVDLIDMTEQLGHCITKNDNKWVEFQIEALLKRASPYSQTTFVAYTQLLQLQRYCLELLASEKNEFDCTQLKKLEKVLKQDNLEIADFDFQLLGNKFIQIINFAYERFDYENNSFEESKQYMKKIFELYKLMDQKKVILYLNRISFPSYVSIIIVSAYLGEFSWCEKFQEKYKKFISGQQKEQAIDLAYAYYLFYSKNYSATLEILSKMEAKHIFIKIHCRLLHLYSLYESYVHGILEAEEVLEKIEPTIHFFRREEVVNPQRKEAFHKTVLFINRLAKARNNPNFVKADKQKLKEQLLLTKPILSKPWLFSKIEELPTKD